MKTVSIKASLGENETLNTIYTRRAVRKFKNKTIDVALISKIIDAGRMAPSAMNNQPWKFYIVTNKDSIHLLSREIGKIAAKYFLKAGPRQLFKAIVSLLHFPPRPGSFFKGKDPIFHDAPVVIFMTAPKKNEWAALDIGMCSQNMMLAAKSLGLDSCPIGLAKFIEQTSLYSQLGIPPEEQVHLALIFGYGDENPAIHERVSDNSFIVNEIIKPPSPRKKRSVFKVHPAES